MDDNLMTAEELLQELRGLRRRISELEAMEARRKTVEEDLRLSQQMLQLVLDTIPQRVFWKDRNSTYLGCNRRFAEDAGFDDPGAIKGKCDSEFGWKEEALQYTDDDKLVMGANAPKLDFEELQTRPDGAKSWLRTSKVPLHDREGRVIGILGTYEDITERKWAEEALRYERGLLRTLIDNLPDVIYVKDSACRKILANLADVHMMGRDSEAEVLGKDDFELYPEAVAAPFFDDDRSVLETGRPVLDREECFFDEERKKRWLLTSKLPLRDDKGQIIGLVGIGRDITERKHMEEELRESEERFRLIFENAFDGMSIFEEAEDPVDRRLVECNRRYAELAGRPREELLRLGSMQGLALELSDKNERAITEGNVFRGSFSWIRPDRAENFIEFTAVPIEMRGKKFTIGIDRDVTDRVAAQTEREKLIHQLQAALADVKTLSGLVPICANCKKIRDDKGYWTQIEAYIQAHTPATFSHGICPDCGRKLYPEVYGTDVSETHPL